jgi:GT2 family glycosyltransferase
MVSFLFIAVIYNDVDETRNLCESLLRQKPGDYEFSLILVDNSDLPNFKIMVDSLAKDYSFAIILRTNSNLGYFPAISKALALYAKDYDLVIAGNNDLRYSEDFSLTLANAVYEDDIMVVCPDVVTADGFHQNPHHKHRLGFFEKLYFDIYFSHFYLSKFLITIKNIFPFLIKYLGRKTFSIRGDNVPQTIDQGVGAVYIFLPRFLSIIDYKLYFPGFLYGEEACLSWQVRSCGGRTWYDPTIKVWHAESATLGKFSKFKNYSLSRESYWKIRSKL